MTPPNKKINFEKSIQELESIIERMEQPGQSLDAILADFEKGIHLSSNCQEALNQAEQKIEVLMQENNMTAKKYNHSSSNETA